MKWSFVACVSAVLLVLGCGGPDTHPLVVTWSFDSGDCTSNGVDKVHVTVTPDGGAAKDSTVACADGRADMGVFPAGSYGVHLDGLDASGKIVAADYGVSTTFGDSGPFGDLEVTLHPKPAKVVVTWSPACPSGFQLPYTISIYHPPSMDGAPLTDKVDETSVGCELGTATFASVAPGKYVVELDSRAVNPKVYATKPVTVSPGTDAQVAFQLQ